MRTGRQHEKLAELLETFPPPPEAPAVDWNAIESQLGTPLPGNYKRLCDAYGDAPIGPWGDHLRLIAPGANQKDSRFSQVALAESASARRSRDEQGDEPSVPDYRGWRFFPEADGLLPWARDGGMAVFFEVRGTDPDSWPIVAFTGEVAHLAVVEDPDLVSFLLRVLEERADVRGSRAEAEMTPSGRVEQAWARVEAVLASDYPEALEAVRPGASEEALAAAEAELGQSLPDPYRAFLRRRDGQDETGPWLVNGGMLCSLEYLLQSGTSGRACGRPASSMSSPPRRTPIRPCAATSGGGRAGCRSSPETAITSCSTSIRRRRDAPGRSSRSATNRVRAGLAAPDFASWLEIWADDLECGTVAPLPSPFTDDDEDDDKDDEGGREPITSATWPYP